jgi:hypothetical protein
MILGPPRSVLEVPDEAVLSDQGKRYVMLVNDQNLAQRRAVTLGPTDNGMRIIETGLEDDDWVVITGQAHIRAGERVEPRKTGVPKGSDRTRHEGN